MFKTSPAAVTGFWHPGKKRPVAARPAKTFQGGMSTLPSWGCP